MTGPRPVCANAGRCLRVVLMAGMASATASAQPLLPLRDALFGPVQSDAHFGWSVTEAGDLTADGQSELAVGAHFFNVAGRLAAGAVYIFRGGQPPGTPALLRIDGRTADEHLGEALAGAHDFDGDGRADLAVGAPLRNTPGGSASGAVDLFRGGPGFAGERWASLSGESADDWFGQSVALGDLTGDGIAEIIVGAPYNDRGGSAAGAVFIYRGGAAPPATPLVVAVGEDANDQFGWSVAYLGDFDGDGFGDLAAGARLYGTGTMRARGKVYLFRGGPGLDAVPDGSWLGARADDWFGHSLAGPGDVDGAGRPDLLVGAPFADTAARDAGAAYLFRGEDAPGSSPVAVYRGQSPDGQFGWALDGAGDVTGDGRPDLLVGARLQGAAGLPAAGRIYLFPGGTPLRTAPAGIANGVAADDWLGAAVSRASGFGGMGRRAMAAGAPYNDDLGAAAGRAYVFQTPCPGDLDGDCRVNQSDLGILLSCWGAGGCGDLDADGDTDQADLGLLLANWTG